MSSNSNYHRPVKQESSLMTPTSPANHSNRNFNRWSHGNESSFNRPDREPLALSQSPRDLVYGYAGHPHYDNPLHDEYAEQNGLHGGTHGWRDEDRLTVPYFSVLIRHPKAWQCFSGLNQHMDPIRNMRKEVPELARRFTIDAINAEGDRRNSGKLAILSFEMKTNFTDEAKENSVVREMLLKDLDCLMDFAHDFKAEVEKHENSQFPRFVSMAFRKWLRDHPNTLPHEARGRSISEAVGAHGEKRSLSISTEYQNRDEIPLPPRKKLKPVLSESERSIRVAAFFACFNRPPAVEGEYYQPNNPQFNPFWLPKSVRRSKPPTPSPANYLPGSKPSRPVHSIEVTPQNNFSFKSATDATTNVLLQRRSSGSPSHSIHPPRRAQVNECSSLEAQESNAESFDLIIPPSEGRPLGTFPNGPTQTPSNASSLGGRVSGGGGMRSASAEKKEGELRGDGDEVDESTCRQTKPPIPPTQQILGGSGSVGENEGIHRANAEEDERKCEGHGEEVDKSASTQTKAPILPTQESLPQVPAKSPRAVLQIAPPQTTFPNTPDQTPQTASPNPFAQGGFPETPFQTPCTTKPSPIQDTEPPIPIGPNTPAQTPCTTAFPVLNTEHPTQIASIVSPIETSEPPAPTEVPTTISPTPSPQQIISQTVVEAQCADLQIHPPQAITSNAPAHIPSTNSPILKIESPAQTHPAASPIQLQTPTPQPLQLFPEFQQPEQPPTPQQLHSSQHIQPPQPVQEIKQPHPIQLPPQLEPLRANMDKKYLRNRYSQKFTTAELIKVLNTELGIWATDQDD